MILGFRMMRSTLLYMLRSALRTEFCGNTFEYKLGAASMGAL
jgi:hypothetical protein